MVTTRSSLDDEWGIPQDLGHTISDHCASDVSADGTQLYFMSAYHGTLGFYDIWVVSVKKESRAASK